MGKKYREDNKEKIKKYNKEYYEKNKEKFKEYRESSKIKKYKKDYYEKNKEEIYKKSIKWKTINKKKQNKYFIKYRQKNPKQVIARNKARLIKIPKGQLCVVCNKDLAVEKHHEDYDKPLEVMFVCKKCHTKKWKK